MKPGTSIEVLIQILQDCISNLCIINLLVLQPHCTCTNIVDYKTDNDDWLIRVGWLQGTNCQ